MEDVMKFRPLRLSDKQYFENSGFICDQYRGSELCFANLYVWKDVDKIEIHPNKEFALLKGIYAGEVCFLPPIYFKEHVQDDLFNELENYCENERIPLIMNGLNESMKNQLIPTLSFSHEIEEQADLFEYLHKPSDFFHYSGKKFHGKRNHFNKFIKSYSYSFRSYEVSDYKNMISLIDTWNQMNGIPTLEKQPIQLALNNLSNLNIFCDIIEIDHSIAAFSIGTISHNHTGIILFEKADTSYDGIYAALNSLVASKRYYNCQYINRQEDMGVLELRKSKLSYKPVAFEKKYSIRKLDYYYNLKQQLKLLYQQSFEDSPYYINYFFSEKYHFDRVFTETDKNQVITALHIVDKKLSFHDQEIHYPYIVAASTKEEYRNQGYMRRLLEKALHSLKQNGYLVVGLNPASKTFYQQFGFRFCSFSQPTTLDPSLTDEITYRKIDITEFRELSYLYQKYCDQFDSYILRDTTYWENYMREVIFDDGYFELLLYQNNAIGYLVHVNQNIDEICLIDPKYMNLIGKYSTYTLQQPVNNEEYPYNMIRILNPIALLKHYPFDKTITTQLSIKITDKFMPDNDCTISLQIDNGVSIIKPSNTFDIEITIEDLTTILFTAFEITGYSVLRSIFKPSYNLIFDKF
jgi:predicted acetyltransferase